MSGAKLQPFYVRWQHLVPVFLTVLVIADTVSAIEQSMMYAAFKTIIEETGDPVGAGWLLSAYFVVAGPSGVVAGRLGDMYGRKIVLLAVLMIVCAGSLVSGLSHDMLGIIVGRGLQGVSGAIIPLCVGIYRENSTTEKLGLGLGILLSAHTIGMTLGLLLGGVIVDHHHWRSIFLVAAGFAFVALLAIFVLAPSTSRRTPRRLDWLGFGVAPALGALLFGISALNSSAFSVVQASLIIGGSMLLLGLWAWHELRHDAPLVNIRALKDPNILLANLSSLVTGIGPSQFSLYFALLLQQPRWTGIGFGLSASMAAVWKTPLNTTGALLNPIAGYVTGRVGPQKVLLVGAALQVIGWVAVLLLNHSFWPFLAMAFVCVAGAVIVNVGIVATVTISTPQEQTGEALGAIAVTRSFGNAVGSQLTAVLLSLSVIASPDKKGMTFPDPTAHTYTLLMIIASAVGTLLVALAFGGGPIAALKSRKLRRAGLLPASESRT